MEYTLKVIQRWQSEKSRPIIKKRLKHVLSLKSRDRHKLADTIHDQIFNKFDCLACANCCKTLPALISKRDIKRISKFLSVPVKEFIEKYVRIDEDGDSVINGAPCPFLLEDNKCQIYEVRPASCRQYPHTGESQFFKLGHLHQKNINHCPALFEIIGTLESD